MLTKDFLFAGNAIFTVTNPQGEYYTYRLREPADQNEDIPIWFLSVLTGPDNTSDYTYVGIVTKATLHNGQFVRLTAKSRYENDSKIVQVARWGIKKILEGKELPEGYRIDHIGKCGKCGRPLTTPESIQDGLGPICSGRV